MFQLAVGCDVSLVLLNQSTLVNNVRYKPDLCDISILSSQHGFESHQRQGKIEIVNDDWKRTKLELELW